MEAIYRETIRNFMNREKKEDVWVNPVHGYGIFRDDDSISKAFIQKFQKLGRKNNELR